MKLYPSEARIKIKKSRTRYIAELLDGKELEVGLSGKYVINGIELDEGAKVFVQLLNNGYLDGHILTATDFKVNCWEGWTDEHQPKI